MRISSKIAALAALLAVAGQAAAHGLWTEQRRGNIEVVYGHGAEDDAFKADKINRAWAFNSAGKSIPVTIERLSDHARLKPLSTPAALAVALDNGAWSKTADGQWINQGRSKVANAVEATHTYKYSLAIYQAHAHLPDLKGMRMVIVPLADPLEVGVGKPLPVRVLVDGKPAADIKLIGDYRSAPDQLSATTNAKGEAVVLVRNEGLNVIAAESRSKVDNDADIDSRGYFTSLTFIGQGHQH